MVSVCIATHNGDKYLKEQLDSILIQLGSNDEIIISDDGSTDKTKEIIFSYNDSRIRLVDFKQPVNKAPEPLKGIQYATRNFENALKFAEGDYIFLCDQDDIWYPNKISVMLNALKDHDIVKHNFSIIDENGNVKEFTHYNTKMQTNRNWIHLIKNLPFRGCCMAFRRWILEKAQPFPSNCLQHDSWIGMVAKLKKANYLYIEQSLIYHRFHSQNASELVEQNSLYFKLSYRIKLLLQLISH